MPGCAVTCHETCPGHDCGQETVGESSHEGPSAIAAVDLDRAGRTVPQLGQERLRILLGLDPTMKSAHRTMITSPRPGWRLHHTAHRFQM
jgi:hypothetical protein